MTYPQWPEWGVDKPDAGAWHYWTSPEGAHHAGPVLDTVIAPMPGVEHGAQMYTMIRCQPCMMMHVTPVPSPEVLAQYYTTQFYQQTHPDYFSRYTRDLEWWKMTHEAIITRALAAGPRSGAGRFLEIGCGPGFALDVAHRLGMHTYGIEPSRACLTWVDPRHQVFHGTLESRGADLATLGPMDIIYLYEVLEHQPSPEDFVLRCYDLLASEGILVVQVPNDYNPYQLKACTQYGLPHWWVAPPDHVYAFTPKTLQLLLRRCGFQLCYARSTFPLETFLLEGRMYIGNDTIGRACHEDRMRYELEAWHTQRWQFVEQAYAWNVARGVGRELVYIARKR